MTAYQPRMLRGPLTRALVLENPDPTLDAHLRDAGFDVVRVPKTPGKEELLALLAEHRPHLLFKRSRLVIDADVLDASPDLFGVMLCCIGDDSVDTEACAARGILVQNDPRSNGRSVAELVIGELVMGARRIPQAWVETRNNHWGKTAVGRFELKGKHLGIFGLGNIGKQVARLAEAMGMHVAFFDADEVARGVGEAMDWAAYDSPEELFAASDFVTIHLSAADPRGRPNTGVLTADLLGQLGAARPDDSPRVFINLGRGSLVVPSELRAAVEAGGVRQAFLDVYDNEPQSGVNGWPNPYADLPQVHCTPHIGAATRDAQPRIARKMARTARLLAQQGSVEDCVMQPRMSISLANRASAPHILAVVHSDDRGTKKAVDDAIYAAGVNNLESAHRDFPRFGIAYDVSVLDRALTEDEVGAMIAEAQELTGRDDAIRSVRQVTLR